MYLLKRADAKKLREAVVKKRITESQYEEITGESYLTEQSKQSCF
jgi:uncharacterized XkdX family phage protein